MISIHPSVALLLGFGLGFAAAYHRMIRAFVWVQWDYFLVWIGWRTAKPRPRGVVQGGMRVDGASPPPQVIFPKVRYLTVEEFYGGNGQAQVVGAVLDEGILRLVAMEYTFPDDPRAS